MIDAPLSKNIECIECSGYFVTVGSWGGHFDLSFEIGIREKDSGKFTLIQSDWTKVDQAILAGRAIACLLDGCFTVAEIKSIFRS